MTDSIAYQTHLKCVWFICGNQVLYACLLHISNWNVFLHCFCYTRKKVLHLCALNDCFCGNWRHNTLPSRKQACCIVEPSYQTALSFKMIVIVSCVCVSVSVWVKMNSHLKIKLLLLVDENIWLCRTTSIWRDYTVFFLSFFVRLFAFLSLIYRKFFDKTTVIKSFLSLLQFHCFHFSFALHFRFTCLFLFAVEMQTNKNNMKRSLCMWFCFTQFIVNIE